MVKIAASLLLDPKMYTMKITKVNIAEKFAQVHDLWNPRIVGVLNGQQVKVTKANGEFPWHSHENEDEMFLVISGNFKMELRDETIEVRPGEFIIIPRGVEHRPVTDGEAHILLFEPAGTLNTGNVQNEFTKASLETI
jgi:mannose-6-phosphate isomerase-like protein (cupin superfamily)